MSRDTIIEALKGVQDPELSRSIVALGMVKGVQIDSGEVTIDLEIAGAAPGAREKIAGEVQSVISSIDGVRDVQIRLSKPAAKSASFSAKQPLPGIQHVIAVASGKGGVGKSTVAVNLALSLARAGCRVGLMDGDIYGPNIPMMLGVSHESKPRVSENDKMLPIEAQGIKMISMGLLVAPDQPMVWRGPMLHGAVTQLLQKVEWGELDFLLVDLPPGTGDVQLSLVQTVPLSGAVVVTTPQEVALADVRKGIAMFRKTEVPILGIIENMTGSIFGSGGGEKAAAEFRIPFLGSIPLDQNIREGGDSGNPIVAAAPESPAAACFARAAQALTQALNPTAV
ncbi:MAG: Mrp/NBP35 family ATP-binding protein [Candidatus Omnitrophota bacterium]|nr:Mrp/NBP35 family ATP-binding protein [Candidatus Omnitrophota bacterium]